MKATTNNYCIPVQLINNEIVIVNRQIDSDPITKLQDLQLCKLGVPYVTATKTHREIDKRESSDQYCD
jgi:hypothetical protein